MTRTDFWLHYVVTHYTAATFSCFCDFWLSFSFIELLYYK